MKKKSWVVTNYEISTEKAKGIHSERIRIVFVSDLHNVDLGDHNRVITDEIRTLKPDLILIGGDIILGKPGKTMDNARAFLRNLPGDIPIFAANGNHEYRLKLYPDTYGDMYEQYVRMMEEEHIPLLEDIKGSITIDHMTFDIYGFELPREYYARFYRGGFPIEYLKELFSIEKTDAFKILLTHHPKYFKDYIKWEPDLILSGHYHGGIVRLLGKYPVIGNDFTLFPRYAYGSFEENKTRMVVSAGLGDHTLPLRLWNPRELVVIDIKKHIVS